jgi:hypothetical protein
VRFTLKGILKHEKYFKNLWQKFVVLFDLIFFEFKR